MAGDKDAGLLARHGSKLIRQGYQIVPIMRGKKFPPFNGWEAGCDDEKLLRKWLSGSFPAQRGPKGQERDFTYTGGPEDGVGILTTETPAVDLDIKDEAVAVEMEEFVRFLVGDAPMRIGLPPKRLLLYSAGGNPFRKVQSAFWIDEWDEKHKVEILGQGQQFVALAVHPDTKKPYSWCGGPNPTNTAASDLPILTEQQAREIVAEFERIAKKKGWKKQAGTALARPTGASKIDLDDPFASDAAKTDISDEELHAKLLLTPGAEDHDTWFQVGMALYHQYDGDERGLELWHEWSQTASNYDSDALDARWPTFDIGSKGRQPVTARLIIKLSNEYRETLATETLAEVENDLKAATTKSELKAVCDRVKHLEIDQLARESLVGLIQKSFKSITGQPLRIAVARDMIRFENPDVKQLPRWLEGWVYFSAGESFYNQINHVELSKPAFNDVHGRFLLTKKDVLEGRSTPEAVAAHVALNLHQIEIVENRMYMPGEDAIFTVNRRRYVNNYDERNVVKTPDVIDEHHRKNVEIVVGHAEHLFPVPRDRGLFLDYLAHIIQGGPRIDWAILMQGTEQDGKTFWARLLSAILGWENVHNLQADALEEKFTPWAEGCQVNFFEEIKLHGHNRFDVLNKLKPKITNPTVDVRRMGIDRYQVINTANYILTTNYRDALPLDKNDSRYFVLFSRFQSQDALNEFKANDPTYYQRLHDALDESGGAIRRWFLDRVPSKEFNHTGRAPFSAARKEMVSYAMTEEQQVLEEIISESPAIDISSALLDSTKLSDEMNGRDCEPPYGRAMTRMLVDAGFTRLKKVRIGDHVGLFWSRTPERFRHHKTGEPDELKIKGWLNPGL